MADLAPAVMDTVVAIFADGHQRRARHADAVWDVLSRTERLLFAEAAVLGYAAGIHDHADATDPVKFLPAEAIDPEAIAFYVISTCNSMSDLHKFLGNIDRRRRPRNSGQQFMQGMDVQFTRDLIDYHSNPEAVTEDRAGQIVRTWDALSLPEKNLVKNAAVVGYVNAVRNHGSICRSTIPNDSIVICKALDAAVQFAERFSTLGGALAGRRAHRRERTQCRTTT